jgi:hypothetical protein
MVADAIRAPALRVPADLKRKGTMKGESEAKGEGSIGSGAPATPLILAAPLPPAPKRAPTPAE